MRACVCGHVCAGMCVRACVCGHVQISLILCKSINFLRLYLPMFGPPCLNVSIVCTS